MSSQKEEALERALKHTKELGALSQEASEELSGLFGRRFQSALQVVKEGRVKRYVFSPSNRVLWIVVGRGRDYEVLPEAPFCSCQDFYFKVLEGEAPLCYHILAQRLAEATGSYELFREEDGLYEGFMAEWRKPERQRERAAWLRYVEDVKEAAAKVLSESETKALAIRELYLELLALGFEIPSLRSLVSALISDPRRRFRCTEGRWKATSPSP